MNPHLDDGMLIRLIDREGSAIERTRLATHVGACDDCHRRHATLAAWSRRMSAALADADPPARPFALGRARRALRVPWHLWPAAAAAVLLVLGTVTLGAPVRAWVVERWAGIRRLLDAPAADTQTPPQRPSVPVGVVSFTPDSDVLVVRVATRQAEGSLVLETSGTATASAVVRGQGEHEAIVVLPNELRIANTPASRATYRVTLPARLKRVVVVIGGEPAVSLDPVAPGDSRALDLRMKGGH